MLGYYSTMNLCLVLTGMLALGIQRNAVRKPKQPTERPMSPTALAWLSANSLKQLATK